MNADVADGQAALMLPIPPPRPRWDMELSWPESVAYMSDSVIELGGTQVNLIQLMGGPPTLSSAENCEKSGFNQQHQSPAEEQTPHTLSVIAALSVATRIAISPASPCLAVQWDWAKAPSLALRAELVACSLKGGSYATD